MQKQSKAISLPSHSLPIEVVNLLNVFARIESRRQAKLRMVVKKGA